MEKGKFAVGVGGTIAHCDGSGGSPAYPRDRSRLRLGATAPAVPVGHTR
jgi:hypothetical protein